MTKIEAQALALKEARKDRGDLVVLDDLTQEHDFGWVFFVNSPEFARSRNLSDAIPGAGAIIVDRDDGSVHGG